MLKVSTRDDEERVCVRGEEGEKEEEEEGGKRAAEIKYEQFKKECGDLLDPALSAEFTLMQSLGLPTKLINSYGDIDSNEVCDIQMFHCSLHSLYETG